MPSLLNSLFMGFDLGFITAPMGVVQGAWNLYKDFANLDMKRQVDANSELMGLQHDYNLDSMAKQNEYALNMLSQQNNYNVQNMQKQFDLNSKLQDRTFDFNREMQQNQVAANAMLNDQGRAIAQLRASGINPSGGANPSGSISAPSASPASVGLPSSSAPSVSALGASFGAPSVSRYMLDALSTVETGLKLDTYREEIRKRKAESKKAEAEKKISETEADNRQKWLDTLMQNGTTEAEAKMLQAQVDAGYKSAMVEIQEDLNEIRSRGVSVEEGKLQSFVWNMLSQVALNLAKAETEEQYAEIMRKEKVHWTENFYREFDLKGSQSEFYGSSSDVNEAESEKLHKDVHWYEIKTLINGAIGAAFARGFGSASGITVKGFGR